MVRLHDVLCEDCGVKTGTSPEPDRKVVCHSCNWKRAFKDADESPNHLDDRAFADEDREPCQTCDGSGEVCDCCGGLEHATSERLRICGECDGTGFESPVDTREDDAYEEARDADIEF